jgi:hypothetical protein
VIVLFRHGQNATLASVARREHKTQGGAHVLQKVSLLKDIRLHNPHGAHLKILEELHGAQSSAHNWSEFLARWNAVLDIAALNKRFYRELSDWFFAARAQAHFPDSGENAIERGLIRLITRLIFTWFVKERGLVPYALFDPARMGVLLKDATPQSDSYYRAVLQNLFFATLNTERDTRRFRKPEGGAHGQQGDYGLGCYFRYESEFQNPDAWLELVKDVPFLNGGLFECLDPEDKDGARIDGISDNPKKQAHLGNALFWGEHWQADLSDVYDDKRQKAVSVTPLLNLLHSYKFTVDENTPLEEDVALDPELLGKVFENLLASYNPETRTTARKQTGSFYTPREIVSYMVEEALHAYLQPIVGAGSPRPNPRTNPKLSQNVDGTQGGGTPPLRVLLSDGDARSAAELGFSQTQIEALIAAIERCTILDPACGSGAFPMGALSKMVALLVKLDPANNLWRAAQLQRVALELGAHAADESAKEEARRKTESIFNDNNADYTRKLFLIENCLFGVDIQPVALQIAKLRFFIALIIDQRIEPEKPNFNIRALPNLETKFVAANTLIAPEAQSALGNLFVLEELKALADVRRKHFSANTRQMKKKLRDKDKVLREALKETLSQEGVKQKTALEMVEWDLYNPEKHAPFFDPEWMFGPELKDGFDIVIGNPPYVRQEAIKEIKPKLTEYSCYAGTADLYVYFFERSVRLLKEGGVLAFICSNKFFRAGYGARLRAFLAGSTQLARLIDFGDAPVFTAIAYPHILVTTKTNAPQNDKTFPALSWELGRDIDEFRAVVQADSFEMPQKNLSNDGWRFEKSDTLDLLEKLRAAGTPLGEYVGGRFYRGVLTGLNEAFVVDRATRDALIAQHASSAEVLKPFLRGRDVKRWRVQSQDLWLIFTRRGIDIEKYPAIKRHLEKWKERLTPGVLGGRKPGSYQWFEIQDTVAYWQEFEKPKIVYPDIAVKSEFGFDDGARVLANTGYIIPNASKFLLACLNSRVLWHYYLSLTNTIRGGYVRYISQYVEKLPIPSATPAQQASIALLVDQILALKSADPVADVSVLEAEIDELVASLYGLDANEKALIGL